MKKVIILNAGPRKNFNTAKMLKEAQRGAEAAGAETEYFNLDYANGEIVKKLLDPVETANAINLEGKREEKEKTGEDYLTVSFWDSL